MDLSSSPSPFYARSGGEGSESISKPVRRPSFQPSSPSPLYQSDSYASSSRFGPSTSHVSRPTPAASRQLQQSSHPLSSPLQRTTNHAHRRSTPRSGSHHVTLGSSPTAFGGGPSRSSATSSSPLGSNLPPPSSQAPPPPTVVDVLWRERFKARCSDRVKRERARAVRNERERRGVVWESSEGDEGEMDLDENVSDSEDEEIEKEIFRRIINSQLRRQAREQARGADQALGGASLDALLQDEELLAASPTSFTAKDDNEARMNEDGHPEADMQSDHSIQDDDAEFMAAFDEIDDESLEAAYLDALMAADAVPARSAIPMSAPPLSAPSCPHCWRPAIQPSLGPPLDCRLIPTIDGGLACNECAFMLGPEASVMLARTWNDLPHGGSVSPQDHVPFLAPPADDFVGGSSTILNVGCTAVGCPWAPRLADELVLR